MSKNESERASFSGRLGFVMAAAASAVGLGNLWRFPYLTSHYGGGIFVIVYIILAITFGFSLMVAEVALGRKTGKSCISAFGDLCKKYKWIGVVAALVPLLIVPYYCVIGGWVTKWFSMTVTGDLATLSADGGSYWWNYITGEVAGMSDPTLWFIIFAMLCIMCVVVGVDKGIEKLSKILMPLLLVMMVGITIYEFTLPGIWDGVAFYLNPDISKLSGGTFLGAVSQIFYSMSLAMGIMITYGSYMKKDVSIEKSTRNISLIDTIVAIMAGLMIVPAAYSMGLGDSKGMGLMFMSLPQVFEQMPAGDFIAPIFYLLVLFAALTSAVSLLETVVSVFVDLKKVRRNLSIGISSVLLILLGIVSVMGFGPWMTNIGAFDQGAGWLGIFDTLTNSILMPIIAILTCLFIGYVIKINVITDEVEAEGNAFKSKRIFEYMIKYICPICLAAILVFGMLDMFGVFSVY
ncbi:MAG: sodium-dependent transporter [Candidatus Methanomethylophilaceae archaeon]|nr:sodium-dependent transporter [Candidatus Methanomethylophilaceae archaeon]